MAAHLAKSVHTSEFTEKSLVYAVNEVCSAVVNEATTVYASKKATGSTGGVVVLHGCTDAAWTGTVWELVATEDMAAAWGRERRF